jgi:hypothetical protein
MSSVGSAWTRYWRIQNTPSAVTMLGTITAGSVPVQPYSAMRMNSGMMPSWVGTAMVAITNR